MIIVEKRLGCKWSRSQMASEIWKPNLEKSRQMAAILSYHLKSRQRCPDFEWSGFKMAGIVAIAKARPLEIKVWILKWTDFRSPLYLLLLWGQFSKEVMRKHIQSEKSFEF